MMVSFNYIRLYSAMLTLSLVATFTIAQYYDGICQDTNTVRCGDCTSVRQYQLTQNTYRIGCRSCRSGYLDNNIDTYSRYDFVDLSFRCSTLTVTGLVLSIVLPVFCCVCLCASVIFLFKRHKSSGGSGSKDRFLSRFFKRKNNDNPTRQPCNGANTHVEAAAINPHNANCPAPVPYQPQQPLPPGFTAVVMNRQYQ